MISQDDVNLGDRNRPLVAAAALVGGGCAAGAGAAAAAAVSVDVLFLLLLGMLTGMITAARFCRCYCR